MVAYSFNKIFVPQVEAGVKRQTVRGHRQRHARPGEPVQLYTAMRTRHCRKLVEPDPVCVRVDEIRIAVREIAMFGRPSGRIEAIEINGRELSPAEIAMFALNDGFDPARLGPLIWPKRVYRSWVHPDTLMGIWWYGTHGPRAWAGVVVYWAPAGVAVCA